MIGANWEPSAKRSALRVCTGRHQLLAGLSCILTLAFCAGAARADYVFLDNVIEFYDGHLGGSYADSGWVNAHEYTTPIDGPYGGWYDGHDPTSPGPHPGYAFTFPMTTTAYQITSIEEAIFKEGPNDPPTYVFRSNPAPSIDRPTSFLSLPGTSTPGVAANSYVVVGMLGKAIDPSGAGNDLLVSGMAHGNMVEQAYVYGTTGSGWQFIGMAQGSQDTEFDLSTVFTEPVLAIKIEGADLEGTSFGFDLSRVMVSSTSIIDPSLVPEPASMALLALGGLFLMLGYSRARKSGRSR